MKNKKIISVVFGAVFACVAGFGAMAHAQTVTSTASSTSSETTTATTTTTTITGNASTLDTMQITPQTLPDGVVNVPYYETLTVDTDMVGPFEWTITSGALPAGLSFDAASTGDTMTITGTPVAVGSSTFTISVTNHTVAESQSYMMNVDAQGASTTASTTVMVTSATSTPTSSSATTTLGASNTVQLQTEINQLMAELEQLEASAESVPTFSRDLTIGDTGPDVLALQQFLNNQGYLVATTGPGSLGSETDYFGPLTQAAVMKWQAAMGISPANGYFGPESRTEVASLTSSSSPSTSASTSTNTSTTSATTSTSAGVPMIPTSTTSATSTTPTTSAYTTYTYTYTNASTTNATTTNNTTTTTAATSTTNATTTTDTGGPY